MISRPPIATAAARTESLARRLLRVAPDEARLSRIMFDARFERWLADLLDEPTLAVTNRPAAPAIRALDIETDHGCARLAVDTSGWPAFELALNLGDAATANTIATMLLEPLAAALSPALPGLRVAGWQRDSASRTAVPAIVTSAATLALRSCDAALAAHLVALLARQPGAGASKWAALRLPTRVRLASRRWPTRVLRSLGPGDAALLGITRDLSTDNECRGLLIAGLGTTLRAAVDIHPQEHSMKVADDPHFASDEEDDEYADTAGSLDDLQVPVAFEVDTARISLGELAGMRPGYAIELDVPLLEATVRLVCHGQTVGHGQLVAIGEQLGVRITRMGLAQHDAAAQR